jgi:hypothetical protein
MYQQLFVVQFQSLLLEHHDVKLAIKSPQNHLLVHHHTALDIESLLRYHLGEKVFLG